MSAPNENKTKIADLGRKLAHLEGILGAYLPHHVFDSDVQQRELDCSKFVFSRLKTGGRQAANWELGRFIELFDLARYGFDYTLLLMPFDAFATALRAAEVGSYGATAATRLREALRARIDVRDPIKIHRDRRMNVGGIGGDPADERLLRLSYRDRVTVTVPLEHQQREGVYLLLLHDFPAERAMSCLMPSLFAPEGKVTGTRLRLPQNASQEHSFPVAGVPGYRCFYGIQSDTDLAEYIGLRDADDRVPDIKAAQVAMLVDLLGHARDETTRMRVSFGEYLMT